MLSGLHGPFRQWPAQDLVTHASQAAPVYLQIPCTSSGGFSVDIHPPLHKDLRLARGAPFGGCMNNIDHKVFMGDEI